MKILLFYFSGTGNTQKIVQTYKEALEQEGALVTLGALPDENGELSHVQFDDFDMIGFGYPIHAFNAPANVLAFAKSLPRMDTVKKGFIVKSSGEPVRMSDVSSLKLCKILKKKNVVVTNEYQYVMPYNIIFRHSDEMAHKMWSVAQRVIPIDCREILSGEPHMVRRLFMGGVLAWFLRIEHWGARFNGRRYKVTKDCVHCGLCANNCPTQNITMKENGKFTFGKNCLMCMRCSFYCPQNAIKIGFFNGWKVNGPYSFREPPPSALARQDKHASYCAKAYTRYFRDAEKRIEQNKSE